MIDCKVCNKKFKSIKELSKHLVEEHKFTTEQLYNYYDYSFETGKAICPICGKEFVMTKRQMDGFKKNPNKSIGCCTSCSKAVIIVTHGSPLANPEIQQKIKDTVLSKYGVEYVINTKELKDKMRERMIEKYGVENPSHSNKIKQKRKETNLKKYGVPEVLSSKEIKNKAKETNLKKYGVENVFQSDKIKNKIKETNLEKYGVEYASQSKEVQEKIKQTNLEKYGAKYLVQSQEVRERIKQTNLEKYGVEFPLQSQEIRDKTKATLLDKYGIENPFQNPEVKEKIKSMNLEKYGVPCGLQAEEIKEKIKETNLEKYGVEYFCQHEKCIRAAKRRVSKINRKFHEYLNESNIDNELEFIMNNHGYDLKVENTLIEIDPWVTHNVTIGPSFGGKEVEPRPIGYHLSKTEFAKEHGYNCIHIFDWDDWNKVISLLQPKSIIYARNCEIKKVKNKEVKEFLDLYHLQGSTKSLQYAYGLFYKDELVEVMTFGKPRYNKNYEYELLRLCTKPEFKIVGGASKLLKYFEKQVKPESIISYCDLSKFNGDVYEKLEFKLNSKTAPARHWYNPKTKRHISDNLLRQRGFDQLHNANFGKGTSNEELMIEHGYIEIYDCGQLVFVK